MAKRMPGGPAHGLHVPPACGIDSFAHDDHEGPGMGIRIRPYPPLNSQRPTLYVGYY
jgi:hypothetical protein